MTKIANWFKDLFNQWSGNVMGYLVYLSNLSSAIELDTTNIDNKMNTLVAYNNTMQAKLTNMEINSYRMRYATSYRGVIAQITTLNAAKVRITNASGITTDISIATIVDLSTAQNMAILALSLKSALGRDVEVGYELVGTSYVIYIFNCSMRMAGVSLLNSSNTVVASFTFVASSASWDIP